MMIFSTASELQRTCSDVLRSGRESQKFHIWGKLVAFQTVAHIYGIHSKEREIFLGRKSKSLWEELMETGLWKTS